MNLRVRLRPDGLIEPADPAAGPILYREWKDRWLDAELDPVPLKGETRSDAANRRYWKVIVPLVRHVIDEDRAEHGKEPIRWGSQRKWKRRIHETLVARHAGVIETPAGVMRVETHTMTKREFYDFTESVSLWLREHGYQVPELAERDVPRERAAEAREVA